MPTSFTVTGFVNRIAKYEAAVGRVPRAATKEIAKVGRAVFTIEAQRASGGDSRLSKVGKAGAKIGVSAKATDDSVTFKARGPWQFVEFPTKPHIISSKRFTGNRIGRGLRVASGGARLRRGYVGRREAAIRTPFGPRMYVKHPGVRNPKKPFAAGRRQVLEIAPRVARTAAKAEFDKVAK